MHAADWHRDHSCTSLKNNSKIIQKSPKKERGKKGKGESFRIIL
jgi:hypothetical protein